MSPSLTVVLSISNVGCHLLQVCGTLSIRQITAETLPKSAYIMSPEKSSLKRELAQWLAYRARTLLCVRTSTIHRAPSPTGYDEINASVVE